MTAVIFTGPTMPAADIKTVLDAQIMPPVAQGDVYRVAREAPLAIGIIDGYFDGVPSVWHKEILWAIEQGITVFGSASMGALRAAELKDFGMIGVGSIFEDYSNGALTDDDEVAVLHAPAELGFAALSEPMVSVRATVERARTEQVLTGETADRMISCAKSLHYRDRTWDTIIAGVSDEPAIAAFSKWLPDGKVDAKNDDARKMLEQMASFLQNPSTIPKPQAHRVERTLGWQGLVRRVDTETASQHSVAEGILDELRLDPKAYETVREIAALRSLAVKDAKHRGVEVDRDTLRALMERHRRKMDLPRRDVLLRWFDDNDLYEQSYTDLLEEIGTAEEVITALQEGLEQHILTELRWTGKYSDLKARADAKAKVMKENQVAVASPERLRMLVWFFENQLDQHVPDDLDTYATSVGLAGRDELFELIEREFLYCLIQSEEHGTAKAD